MHSVNPVDRNIHFFPVPFYRSYSRCTTITIKCSIQAESVAHRGCVFGTIMVPTALQFIHIHIHSIYIAWRKYALISHRVRSAYPPKRLRTWTVAWQLSVEKKSQKKNSMSRDWKILYVCLVHACVFVLRVYRNKQTQNIETWWQKWPHKNTHSHEWLSQYYTQNTACNTYTHYKHTVRRACHKPPCHKPNAQRHIRKEAKIEVNRGAIHVFSELVG